MKKSAQQRSLLGLEEKKLSQVELAKRFDCSQSTISKIAKNKPAILCEAKEKRVGDRKRKRSGKDEDVEKALFLPCKQSDVKA